jgi:hypothetical protein
MKRIAFFLPKYIERLKKAFYSNLLPKIKRCFTKDNWRFWKTDQKFNLFSRARLITTIALMILSYFADILLGITQLNTEFFSASQSYFDVDMSDYWVSRRYKKEKEKNNLAKLPAMAANEFTLIDITDLDRRKIADIINKIRSANPRVIGLDVYFEKKKQKSSSDSALLNALSNVKESLVLGELRDKEGRLVEGDERFNEFDKGIINFIAHDSTSVIRFIPTDSIAHNRLPFSYAIATKYDPATFVRDTYAKRDSKKERIHYDESISFTKFTSDSIFNMDHSALALHIEKKIVMLGNLDVRKGGGLVADLHFTPANSVYVGRSFPDKYGLEIHAYAVMMFLSGNYYTEVPGLLSFFVAAVMCYFMLAFQEVVTQRHSFFIIVPGTLLISIPLLSIYFFLINNKIVLDVSGVLGIYGLAIFLNEMRGHITEFFSFKPELQN